MTRAGQWLFYKVLGFLYKYLCKWISILTVKAERMCIKLANEYNREFKAGHQSHLVDEIPHFLITKKALYIHVYT